MATAHTDRPTAAAAKRASPSPTWQLTAGEWSAINFAAGEQTKSNADHEKPTAQWLTRFWL